MAATGTERKTDRLEAFSDAVFAIGMTLPVVAIHPPTSGSLAAGYRALLPDIAAYAASVVVIGLFWAHSHFSGKIVVKTDHGFNLLTVVFLALVTLTPFPARPFFAHLAVGPDAQLAAAVYAWALAVPIVVWALRWNYSRLNGMPDPRLTQSYVRGLGRKYWVSAAIAVAGAAATTWLDRRAIAVTALVVLAYVRPPVPPEYQPGKEPADELEEADEKAR